MQRKKNFQFSAYHITYEINLKLNYDFLFQLRSSSKKYLIIKKNKLFILY